MRLIAIFSMLLISTGIFAQQQERKLQRPDELQQKQPGSNTVTHVAPATSSAPRQMIPLGSEPVHAKPGATATPVQTTPGPERKMVPLNPDKPVQKNN